MDSDNQTYNLEDRMVSDNGIWRLVIDISRKSLRAWLRNTDDDEAALLEAADVSWDGDATLANIENAVYDNPKLLDDFEADIIVTTERHLALPAEFEGDDALIAKAYAMAFNPVDESEIMTDLVGDYLIAYHLTPGLKAFLSRTFPGARVKSHIARLADHEIAHHIPAEQYLACYAEPERIDIIGIDNGKLTIAQTRACHRAEDLAYYLLNTDRALHPGMGNEREKCDNVYLHTYCGREYADAITDSLSKIKNIPYKTIERLYTAYPAMSAAAALCCARRRTAAIR